MRRGSSSVATSVFRSGERPVASDSARSTSSCRRRTCASISMLRSDASGSGFSSAVSTPRSLRRNSARARTMPSTSTRMPPGDFAIWRMTATVPTRCRSSSVGSSVSFCCISSRTRRSPASARFTASTDSGRLTPSGATVSGNTTAPRSGRTGSSDGRAGVCGGSGMLSVLHRLGELAIEQHHPAIIAPGVEHLRLRERVNKSFRVASAFSRKAAAVEQIRTCHAPLRLKPEATDWIRVPRAKA